MRYSSRYSPQAEKNQGKKFSTFSVGLARIIINMPPNNEIHIRKATPDDARQIADFNREMAFETEGARLGPETTLAGVRRMIQDRNLGFYLVAESGREIVASLMITTEWSDWRNGVFWWIQSVYVMPRWRRKGNLPPPV